jgi:hypothetical protein
VVDKRNVWMEGTCGMRDGERKKEKITIADYRLLSDNSQYMIQLCPRPLTTPITTAYI